MGKIKTSHLLEVIERNGKEVLTDEQFDQVFQFNTRKNNNSRLSLQLKSPKILLQEPLHNQAKNGTVRIWTDQPDKNGGVTQLAVIGSELYEHLEAISHLNNIFVIKAIGSGYTKKEAKVIKQRGAVPSTPEFANEPRVATVLWFAAAQNHHEAQEVVNTFLTAYFQLVKTWL